jgi:signal transduction histidine kinase
MKKSIKQLSESVNQYHFQLKHLMVLFLVLGMFFVVVSVIQKTTLKNLLINTQDWYQRDSAEMMANLTATSIELLLETTALSTSTNQPNELNIIQALNIILSQQKLEQHAQELCLLIDRGDSIVVFDNGKELYDYFFLGKFTYKEIPPQYQPAVTLYRQQIAQGFKLNEKVISYAEDNRIFHVFVPFVPKGELQGALYVKNMPDFSFITTEIIASYDETALIFAIMIVLGLLAMFYISSYTVKERDETQKLLYEERENHIRELLERQKEEQFTKRIYHTHHKAEKIMGFMKEDLRQLSTDNIDEIKHRMMRYANFISRVIYDMKWYDPPIQAIRSSIFSTDVNEVITFLVKHIFLRTSRQANFKISLDLDEGFPRIQINEFVVWEVIEPLIQNSIEHAGKEALEIVIQTRYFSEKRVGEIVIADNGKGIEPALFEETESGVKKIFLENISTKNTTNSGYGCYLAYDIAQRRCGWHMDVENLEIGGCRFVITVKF